MIIYLYKKTHKNTGLKYLGKTKQDPFKYPGSGKYWKLHLKTHGNITDTEIIKICNNTDEIKYWGLYYSNLWNIVESDEWANLRPEDGDGGTTFLGYKHTEKSKKIISETHKNKPKSKEHIKKMSQNRKGFSWGNHTEESKKKIRKHKHTEEFKNKLSESRKGINNPMFGKTLSEETKQKISDSLKKRNAIRHLSLGLRG
jgi:hypothetical protein